MLYYRQFMFFPRQFYIITHSHNNAETMQTIRSRSLTSFSTGQNDPKHSSFQCLSSQQSGDPMADPLTEVVVILEEPSLKICHSCMRFLVKTVLIATDSVLYCVGCFAKQQLFSTHYRVVSRLDSVLRHGWDINHEVLLLQAIGRWGFGNWEEVHLEMEKYNAPFSKQEVEQHYEKEYLRGTDFLPGKRASKCLDYYEVSQFSHLMQQSQAECDNQKVYFNHLSHQEVSEESMRSYNPKRNEFYIEYDQAAELLLADLEFRDDDDENEVAVKMKLISEYNKRIEKRRRVHTFVLEHRLLDQNYLKKKMDCQRDEYEKEAYESLKPLAYYMTLEGYTALVRKFAFAKKLQSMIECLRQFRRKADSAIHSVADYKKFSLSRSIPKNLGRIVDTQKPFPCTKLGKLLKHNFQLDKSDLQHILKHIPQDGEKYTFKGVVAALLPPLR